MKKQRTGPRGLWILPLWRSTYILAVAIAMPRYAIFSIMSGFLSIRVRFWLCGKSTRRVWPVQEMIVVANVLLLLYYCFRFTNTEAAINLECKSIVDNRLRQENGLIAGLISSLLSIFSAFLCLFVLIICLECESTIHFCPLQWMNMISNRLSYLQSQ